ncbi:biopolymer transporter ExbD [Sphingomonas koreensis]|uniref:ExbD/TolR family protein n=1 Tax=Sphingomonas koreensis TaxID=93064 RepID=UPI000F7E87F5|nr:biopolymer transporter ExbD [Sphingomonas koreensis]RSU46926.1 biopolymer transporter ExbD [Sphingomonas koreensis]
MAIQIGDEDKPYNEINVTPMIDVMLVLLIIFILLTTAAVQGIKVDLPSASSAKPLEAQKSRVIAVADDGTISIDAIPVSLSELERELRTSIASTPDLAVILRGDRAVQYDKVMQVLDLCSKVGVPSLGMASTRPPGGGCHPLSDWPAQRGRRVALRSGGAATEERRSRSCVASETGTAPTVRRPPSRSARARNCCR